MVFASRSGITLRSSMPCASSHSRVAELAGKCSQRRFGERPQLADRFDAQPLEGAAGHAADAPQATDRQRIEKLLHVSGGRRPSRRAFPGRWRSWRETCWGPRPTEATSRSSSRISCLIRRPIARRVAEQVLAAGHVEKRFVQRQRLDQRRVAREDRRESAAKPRRNAASAAAARSPAGRAAAR